MIAAVIELCLVVTLLVVTLLVVARLAYLDSKEADRLEALRGNPPMRDRR